MTPTENLHYALGLLAYAVARADGEVQKEERVKFSNIVASELRCKNYDFNVSDIIFQVLDGDKVSVTDAYDWAMKQIRLNKDYLTPCLTQTFISVMQKVAKAYPPVTTSESQLIKKFIEDIENVNEAQIHN